MGRATDGAGGVRASAAALALLAGCAHDPLPDAPTVLAEPLPVECPAAEVRTPPAVLLAPFHVEPPELVAAGQGDYGITRDSVERVITLVRACSERNDQWKAWASPTEP